MAAHIIEHYRDSFIDPFLSTEPVLRKFFELYDKDCGASPAKSESMKIVASDNEKFQEAEEEEDNLENKENNDDDEDEKYNQEQYLKHIAN